MTPNTQAAPNLMSSLQASIEDPNTVPLVASQQLGKQ